MALKRRPRSLKYAAVRLLAGEQVLAELPLGVPFMPYASYWYENHFAANVALEAYAAVDSVQVLVSAEEVSAI